MADYTVQQAQNMISGASDDEVLTRYLDSLTTGENPVTTQELLQLRDANYISNAEVASYPARVQAAQNAGQKPAGGASNIEGLHPYNPQTGTYSGYPAESPIGNYSVEGHGGVNTYADPQTGLLYNDKGTLLPKYLQVGIGGVGGADHYATDSAAHNAAAQLAYEYSALEEKKAEFGLTFEEQQRQFEIQQALAQQQANQSYVEHRAVAGQNLGEFVRGLSNDVYQRALDPGNYPAYLAASAGLPQGTGSPISALVGQGTQIQSPEGSNPLADPRFKDLISELYGYAKPDALQTVQNLASQNGGQLPQGFYDYTGTQNPNVHASGGTQMLTGPTVGIPAGQLQAGQTPEFLAGEAGAEKLTFTPMHAHATNGLPVPHQHEGGHASHDHLGPVIRYADGGTVISGTGPTQHQLIGAWNAYNPNDQKADTVFTPAEGTAISLGKALQPLGYVPSFLISQLLEGRTPTPGSVDEATLSRLPPSLRALLQAQVRSALGGAGVQDYNFQLQQNALPGINNGGVTGTVYSS